MFTDHGEQVRVVHGAVPVFALVQVWSVQDSGHHQAKVGSKGVDGHGAAGILCLKQSSVLRLYVVIEWISPSSSQVMRCTQITRAPSHCEDLTPNAVSTMNSLTANSVTSNIAMISSWTGLVLPRTAPKEINTEPVQKSALIILEKRRSEDISS